MRQNFKIVVSYDGTDYHGWQRQPQKRTIQGCLEKALTRITGKNIPVIGAGRTDAGVHALAQVAHFRAVLNLQEDELMRAFHSLLPRDIRITALEKTPPDFHARKSAKSKIYQYRIFNAPDVSPFLIRYVLPWFSPLDIKAMQKAANKMKREDDFSPFSSNRQLYSVRKITRSEIEKKGKEILYTVEANGFLRYMVRTMVGTLLEIGRGKRSPDIIDTIFKEKKRTLASPTAPAQGLCLIKVNYP
jgi:tRNA pseudouridine38-40 synthase